MKKEQDARWKKYYFKLKGDNLESYVTKKVSVIKLVDDVCDAYVIKDPDVLAVITLQDCTVKIMYQ